MILFVLRRCIQAIVVVLIVSFVSFAMFTYVGDPVNNMVGEEAGPAERAELRTKLGLDDSVPVQFARFARRAASADFGISYRNAVPVTQLLTERLPATLELVICATIFALVLGILFGVYTGIRQKGLLSQLIQMLSLAGISLPSFVVGILLILVFSVTLNWLPSFGRGEVTSVGGWTTGFLTLSGIKALILPSITLGLYQMTLIMRLVRSEMLEVLRTDHIKFARARGLPERLVYFRHALKNTLIPVITITGLQIGSLIAFAIVTETVFQWPGMGLLFIQAVEFADIPVVSAYLVLVAVMFVSINLIVDLLYYAVDPRLRANGAAKK
ncbi:ABC transporter permease [Castellaniella sp. GW247-6E4]|uniref:ABC transporter permease n=1 Tax=Castellaniella sp. GW247-6E4 TaxID=3140380 RepID=UPI0033161CBF